MSDKSLQARNMRKTVERVDIGAFGIPMRISGWAKKKRSTWGGWALLTAIQAVIGGLLGGALCAALGATTVFTVIAVAGFALGSAIGGPLSFAVWTLLLVGITGLAGGLFADAWVASPSWWADLGRKWDGGQPMAGWMKIAFPLWTLLWVAAARGVSKVADIMFEKLALRMGFRAAQKFSGEDKMVYDQAFEQSDVSQAETRSLLESSGDGTHAVITGEPSKMGSVTPQQVREMGGDPDVSPVPLPSSSNDGIDYDSFLQIGDDPEIMKAVGRKSTGLEPVAREDAAETPEPAPSAVLIEMEPLDLPAVPRDTAPPLQRVEAPKLDPRQNRALFRRMTQLNLAFQTARREDQDAEFIEKHQDELAIISDEQRMILDTMNDTGPLLALIHSIQQKRTEDFLVGNAPVDLAPGTGSVVDSPAVVDDLDDIPFAVDPIVSSTPVDLAKPEVVNTVVEEVVPTPDTPHVVQPDGTTDVAEVEPAPAPVKPSASSQRPDIASLAASFSSVLSARRIQTVEAAPEETPASAVSDEVEETSALIDDAPVVGAVSSAPVDVREAISNAEAETSVEEPDIGLGADPIAEQIVPDVVSSQTTSDASADAGDFHFDGAPADAVVVVSETESNSTATDEPVVTTEDTGAVDDVPPADVEQEDGMSDRGFNRSVCRQVLGLVVGPHEAVVKADDVMEFERNNPDVQVAEVINSRSFDEQIGSQEAAAARHAWKDVKLILSQSSLERLMGDFERVNARGQLLLEEPHTLTHASFGSFEADCLRLRRMVSLPGVTDAFEATADLVDRNVAILDALILIQKARIEAASARSSSTPGGIVRQRIPAGRDNDTASRGKSLIGSVLGGARTAGVGVMRDVPAKDVIIDHETSSAVDVNPSDDATSGDYARNDVPAIDTSAPKVDASAPRPGDEGFVSSHPIDSIEYQVEMDMHATGMASRVRGVSAAQERVEHEERQRQEALDRTADDARRVTEEADAELVRQKEADDAKREKIEAEEAANREKLAQIATQTAEAERDRTRAEAEAAELALETERAVAARSKADEAVLKQFRDRERELSIPERFRTDEVIAHSLALAELRNIRRVFQRSTIGAKVEGLSDVEVANHIPAARSLLQTEAEMMNNAAGILTGIGAVLDVADPADLDAVRALLEPDEVRFFGTIEGQLQRSRAALDTLDRAEASDREMRDRAEKAKELIGMSEQVQRLADDVQRLQSEVETAGETARTSGERADRLEREKVEAERALDAIRKEMAGIVDDDFQSTLETIGTRIDVSGVDGIYSFLSPDLGSMVMVMTTPASVFPDGLIQRGSKALTVADFLDFVVSRAKDITTDAIAVLFTDPQMRAYTSGTQGMTMKHIRRSVSELTELLGNYSISIEGPAK